MDEVHVDEDATRTRGRKGGRIFFPQTVDGQNLYRNPWLGGFALSGTVLVDLSGAVRGGMLPYSTST